MTANGIKLDVNAALADRIKKHHEESELFANAIKKHDAKINELKPIVHEYNELCVTRKELRRELVKMEKQMEIIKQFLTGMTVIDEHYPLFSKPQEETKQDGK